MESSYDIILIGLSRLDNILNSSAFNIASEWAKTNRVFYINRPYSLKDYFLVGEAGAEWRNKKGIFGKNTFESVLINNEEIIAVTPALSLPINFLQDGALYDFLHAYNERVVADAVSELIKKYHIKNYVFFNNFIPAYFDVIPDHITQPLLKVYRSSDDISQEPYIAKHGVRKEQIAVKEADLVLVSSFGLQQKLSDLRDPVYRIPNAADFELFNDFSELTKPEDLIAFEGKKLIFLSGNISKLRIDYQLLSDIAVRFADCQLLIAGPVKDTELSDFQLNKFENITWLGAMSLANLARYLAYSDCAIIPFLKNTLTAGIYPLKINEYLAAGKPVVSTNFSEDIAGFSDCIYLANSNEEFIAQIERALNESGDIDLIQQRVTVAKSNNWAHRMAEIKHLVNLHIAEKQARLS